MKFYSLLTFLLLGQVNLAYNFITSSSNTTGAEKIITRPNSFASNGIIPKMLLKKGM